MKNGFAFKCWAVLLICCLAGLPLYAQEDSTETQEYGQETEQPAPQPQSSEPDNQYTPVEQPPSAQGQKKAATSRGAVNNYDDYLLGKQTGKLEAKGKPVWILAGLAGTGLCLCIGVAGIGLAAIVPPSPPESALMGKSTSYIQGYTEGFRANARLKNAGWATLGCAMAALINMVINLATGNNPFEQAQQQ